MTRWCSFIGEAMFPILPASHISVGFLSYLGHGFKPFQTHNQLVATPHTASKVPANSHQVLSRKQAACWPLLKNQCTCHYLELTWNCQTERLQCLTLFPKLISKSSISPSCALKSNFFFRDGNCRKVKNIQNVKSSSGYNNSANDLLINNTEGQKCENKTLCYCWLWKSHQKRPPRYVEGTTRQCLPPKLWCVHLCLLSAGGSGLGWTWPPSGGGPEGSGLTVLQPVQSQRCEPSHLSYLRMLKLHPDRLCFLSQPVALHCLAACCSLLQWWHIFDRIPKGN